MHLIRVEHPADGQGPYNSGKVSRELRALILPHCRQSGAQTHPVPQRDKLVKDSELDLYLDSALSCFRNWGQFHQWFSREIIEQAYRDGFKVYIMTVYNFDAPRVMDFMKQSLVDPRVIAHKKELTLAEVYTNAS